MKKIQNILYVFRLLSTAVLMVYNVISSIQVFTQADVNTIFTDIRYKTFFFYSLFAMMAWWIIEKEWQAFKFNNVKPRLRVSKASVEDKYFLDGTKRLAAYIEIVNRLYRK
jgi:hypothetical protein